VRLSVETERRLEALAARTGRTKTYYTREAIEAHLDDLEDFYLAERSGSRGQFRCRGHRTAR
jgi:RHH-type rel operon transcriptional repressor/antitoxin RelB